MPHMLTILPVPIKERIAAPYFPSCRAPQRVDVKHSPFSGAVNYLLAVYAEPHTMIPHPHLGRGGLSLHPALIPRCQRCARRRLGVRLPWLRAPRWACLHDAMGIRTGWILCNTPQVPHAIASLER